MKLQTLRRGTAAAAILTMSLTLAACGEEDDSSSDSGASDTPSATSDAPEETTTDAPEETPSEATGDLDAVFGPACDQLPADGEPGSLTGMVVDPVATAAGTNPLLTQLVGAVGAVEGLDGVLNSAPELTVFAPFNGAFEEIPPADLTALVDGAKADGVNSDLAVILSHHVLPTRLAPDAIVGDQPTLIGDSLTIAGDPEAGMTVTDGTVTANVLCGGIPTANATVYVIDKVLTGAMPAS
ncbi:fasciclin domain-containing protein [Nocardioides sp.]|uniref:fasciclin domain-containing protein n=1 Tax=Nocardioides sp. TaxID=35761 RepID=UPI00271D6E39|nr:fasciclin domain-containing protein [Nocardioides sp.]MDO9457152.1 fasciclin domain-containing protein [Nocardioides sp.]